MKNISHPMNINDSVRRHIFSDTATIDLEAILYLCPDRICEQCGNDHDFNASFDDVKTSIDNIPELLALGKERTVQCNLVTRNRNETDILEIMV